MLFDMVIVYKYQQTFKIFYYLIITIIFLCIYCETGDIMGRGLRRGCRKENQQIPSAGYRLQCEWMTDLVSTSEVNYCRFPAQTLWNLLSRLWVRDQRRRTAVQRLGEWAERVCCCLWHKKEEMNRKKKLMDSDLAATVDVLTRERYGLRVVDDRIPYTREDHTRPHIYIYIYIYIYIPPVTITIQVRRARHAEHCWRSRDELISDVLLWTLTYGRAKAVRPARTYIQQLCEDTWFGFFSLMAYQLFVGYLMPKPFS